MNGLLASAGGDATIRLWDTSRAEPLGRRLPVRPAELTTAAFASDVRTLAAVNFDGRLTVRDLTRATDPLRFRGDFASAAISPGGGLLAGGGQDGIVRVWELPGRRLLARLPVRQGPNPDLSTFEPEKVPAWERGLDPVWSLAFSADGKTLAAGGRAGSVVYWATAGWRKLGGPLDGGGAAGALAFSADGALLAGARDVAKVWDVTGESRKPTRLPLGGDLISRSSVAFNPDGSTLAAAGPQGIRLWRTAGWDAPGRALQRGAGAVSRIAFSADGATLVAAGDVLRLWDPLRQQELGKPLGTPSFYSLEGLAVGADGRTLVTAAGDGSVIRWDPILLSRDYAAWQKRLCPFAGRNLTRPEWAQYVPGQPSAAPAQGSRRAGSGRRSGTSWSPEACTAERGPHGAADDQQQVDEPEAVLSCKRVAIELEERLVELSPAQLEVARAEAGSAAAPASAPAISGVRPSAWLRPSGKGNGGEVKSEGPELPVARAAVGDEGVVRPAATLGFVSRPHLLDVATARGASQQQPYRAEARASACDSSDVKSARVIMAARP